MIRAGLEAFMLVMPGVLAALAPSAAAGWWLLGGLLVAGAFVLAASRASQDRRLRAVVALLLGVLAAQLFGIYVVPAAPRLAAVVVVLVVAVAVVLGVPSFGGRWVPGAMVLAAASFAAICFGIAPPEGGPNGTLGASHVSDAPFGPVPGVLLATWLFIAPLASLAPKRRALLHVGFAAVATAAVTAGALYQLGSARLRLSDAPLRDALAAADAMPLGTMLAVVVAVGTLPAVLWALSVAQRDLPGGGRGKPLAIAGLATLAAAFVPPVVLLASASAVAFAAALLGWSSSASDATGTRTSE